MHPLEGLNEEQRSAALHDGEHLLIVAGPGTGKTKTLVHRIQALSKGLKPSEKILAVTFTNKAAREMAERIKELDLDLLARVDVATFHSFSLKLLRRYASQLKFPLNFTIASPEDIASLAAEFWPEKSRAARKVVLRRLDDWKASLEEESEDHEVRSFRKMLREKCLVDFDDILRDAVLLLRHNLIVRSEVRACYRQVMVDEYQDINKVQEELLKELVGDGVMLTAIGDPNQAIYGFRGSDVRFFDSFRTNYPHAGILELSRNYRSCHNLLEASGQVVTKGTRFAVPALTAEINAKGLLKVHEAATDKAEAEYIAHSIEKLVGGTSMFSRDSGRVANENAAHSFSDIAVLYRLNAQGRLISQALERLGVPHQVSGDKAARLGASTRAALQRLPQSFNFLESLKALKEQDKDLAANWDYFLALAERSKTVTDFLDAASLETPEDRFDSKVEKVSLMTLHAAKGLEFPVVFIVGCEEGILPLDLEFFSSKIEEERRLFYVGMTRAKAELYLVRARKRALYGQTVEFPPSRFLSDIEEGLKAYEAAREKKFRKDPERDQLKLF